MYKDAEETGQDLGADLLEVLGEGNSLGGGADIQDISNLLMKSCPTLPIPHTAQMASFLAHFPAGNRDQGLLSPDFPF